MSEMPCKMSCNHSDSSDWCEGANLIFASKCHVNAMKRRTNKKKGGL